MSGGGVVKGKGRGGGSCARVGGKGGILRGDGKWEL